MTTTHASPLTRLITPIIKPTIAFIAALAIGIAWADAETIAATLTGATAADDVAVTLAGETVSVDSITAASLTVNGYGKINVAGNVTVSGELAFYPSSAVSGGIQASEGAYTLKLDAEGSVSAGSIAGGGTIDSAVGVTTAGGIFYGTVTGASTLNIAANITLQGRNDLTGGLNISGGTTTLGAYDYSQLVKFDFDTTDRSRWTVDSSDNSVSKLWTKTGGCPGGQLSYSHFDSYGSSKAIVSQSESVFGNQPYLALVDGMNYSYQNSKTSRGRADAWLAVYRVENAAGAGKLLLECNNANHNGYLNLNSSAVWASRCNGSNNDSMVFVDGVRTTQGEFGKAQTVMSFTGVCVNDNRWAALTSNDSSYPGITGALGQIIGFSTKPSVEQYLAINATLMQKWHCDYPEKCQILPTSAPVMLSNGAILDLNNYKETIKSITGTGKVQNGTLTVTDAINLAAGDVLSLPTSAIFTLGTVAAKVVNGEGVTLYGSVQNAINGYTAGTLTVYTTETVAIDKELTISGIVFENGATINFTPVAPFIATLDGDTLTSVRTEQIFVYVGPTAYSATSGNFTIGGVATPAVPGVADTVQFDTATSIYIDNVDIQYDGIVLNADVTVTGAGTKYLRVNTYTGTGVLKLAGNGNLAPQSGATTTIECPVDISGNNTLRVTAENDVTTIKGKLTGNGKWSMSRVGGNTGYSGNIFRCDASEFTGTIEELPCDSNVSRNFTRFGAPEGSNVCDFSNASITLNSNRRSGYGKFLWVNTSTVTYKFGSLKGKVSSTASGYTDNQHCYIEIGALGTNDELTGDWINDKGGREPYLRKVGSGTLTTSVTDTYGYILNGGTLVVMAAAAQKPVSTELAGYEVISTVNYDTEGEDPTVVLSTAYTLRSTVPTWTGAANDNKWTTAGNWDNGVPTSSNVARFPAGTWTVFIDTDAAACAGMDVLGTVEFAQTDRSVGVHNAIAIHGNVTGSGTVRLTHVGLNNASSDTITFSPNLEVLAPAADANSDSWLSGSPFTLSGTVTATGRICPYNINTFTGTINVPAGGSFDARADLNLDGANAVLNISGWFGEGSASDAKWLFPKNGAVINLNAGGTLSLCRITGAGYTLNFNGGTLTEYGAGHENAKIIGGLAGFDDGIISLNVKSLGLNVDTATATTITPALQGDSESTGGGLTKKGEGSLTLAAVPAYTGPTKVEAGALYVVEGGEWTPTLSATVEVNTDREGYRKFIPLKPSGVMLLMF